jgi:hypothetical protein
MNDNDEQPLTPAPAPATTNGGARDESRLEHLGMFFSFFPPLLSVSVSFFSFF